MAIHAGILAGGSGTRLWPASIQSQPKQFLEIREGKTLLEETIVRSAAIPGIEGILIISLVDQIPQIRKICSRLSSEIRKKLHFIGEPEARNTAPAIALASSYVREFFHEDDLLLVMPADHLIEPIERFVNSVEQARKMAENKMIVTFGIEPDHPATGFGYIEAGEKVLNGCKVHRFREKPDLKTAETFLKKGGFYWNSGMFLFSCSLYMQELQSHAPGIAGVFAGLPLKKESQSSLESVLQSTKTLQDAYTRSPKDSIDYAVMEKTSRASVLPVSYNWNDIGSWDDLAEVLEESEGSVKIESSNAFIDSELPVAICGVDDVIVSVRNGRVLIVKRGRTQLVKNAVEAFKAKGGTDTL
jgi:mannose-1-phosphate guanylyltransferase/mannose-6-phosphate isomerase